MSRNMFSKSVLAMLVSLVFTATSVQADWFTVTGNGTLELQQQNGNAPQIWTFSNVTLNGFTPNNDDLVSSDVLVNGATLGLRGGIRLVTMDNVVLQNGAKLAGVFANNNTTYGTIQNLTLGSGSSYSGGFGGTVNQISFGGNANGVDFGSGTLKITGSEGSFNSVGAGSIDLTGGNVVIDAASAGLVYDAASWTSFDLAAYFGSTTIANWTLLNSLSFVFGEDSSVAFISDGALATGWNWVMAADNVTATSVLAYTAPTTSGGAATPEPATLALFGCGLAGLAVLRRRKR